MCYSKGFAVAAAVNIIRQKWKFNSLALNVQNVKYYLSLNCLIELTSRELLLLDDPEW
jgi:hypothetical protein